MDTSHSHPISGTGAEVNCVLVLAFPWGPSWVLEKTGCQLHPPCTSTALVQVQGKAGALLPWKQGQAEEHNQSLYSPTRAYLHRQSLNKPAGKQHSLGVKQHQKQSLEVQHEQRLAQKHGELIRTYMAVGHKLDLISQLRALLPSFLANLTMEAATLLPFALACRGKEKAVTDSGPSCTTQGISHSGASLPMSSGVG